jgi:hypothetical protein
MKANFLEVLITLDSDRETVEEEVLWLNVDGYGVLGIELVTKEGYKRKTNH